MLSQDTLNELFPSWEAVQRHREVVIFTAGLMKDPRPLVQHVYEMQVEGYLNQMRVHDDYPAIDDGLFKLLNTESTVELFNHSLNNRYINYYYHTYRNTTPLYYPSRIYHFYYTWDKIFLGEYKALIKEIPECAMYINWPEAKVTRSLLSKCWEISKHQPVTDLSMQQVHSAEATKAKVLILNRNIQSIHVSKCNFSFSFMRNIFQQLHDCMRLTKIELIDMELREVEEDLDELLENLVSNHEKGLSHKKLTIDLKRNRLSEEFVSKWNECCEGIRSIDCYINK